MFFLLIIRQPPTSTLFPYTTLFRSISHDPQGQAVQLDDRLFPEGVVRIAAPLPLFYGPVVLTGAGGQLQEQGDRKSTRLNSSHMSISYAVFCLKKKTHNIHYTTIMSTCSRLPSYVFLINNSATTDIYTLSLHDALPIYIPRSPGSGRPTRRSAVSRRSGQDCGTTPPLLRPGRAYRRRWSAPGAGRSEEHTSELQSHVNLVCRLLLEKKNTQYTLYHHHVYM